MDDFISYEVDADQLIQQLEQFDSQMPNIARKLMRAVNTEVKKQIKREARSRGYKSHQNSAWGDSGYTKNLKSYADRNFSAKIMMGRNAYQYTFVEYGANVKPKGKYLTFKIGDKFYKSRGFTLPARPFIRPIAQSIWGTNKGSQIMEQVFQKELEKIFQEN